LLVYAAFWSPLLTVREIDVVGARHTSTLEVRNATGLTSKDNLLLLSTAAVEDGVETLPWVKSARVERRLPGTIRIRIEERRPALVLSLGSARWTIDSSGRVLQAGQSDKGLPALGGIELSSVAPGTIIRDPQARAALEVWRSLDKKLKEDVAGIFVPTLERITLSLDGGTLVRFGAAEMLGAKNHVLKALLARLHSEGRSVAYLDVRVPTSPAVGEIPVNLPPPPTTTTTSESTPSPTPSGSPTPKPSPSTQ
jgi:cell division protein FtsQ